MKGTTWSFLGSLCGVSRRRPWRLLTLLLAAACLTPVASFADKQQAWPPDPITPPCKNLWIDSEKQEEWTKDAAWQAFLSDYGENWTVLWNEHNGTPSIMVGDRIALAGGPLDAEQVEQLSRGVLERFSQLFRLDLSQLRLERLAQGHGLWYATYAQVHEGLPVFASRIDLTFSDSGALLLLGSEWLSPDLGISIAPEISNELALEEVLRRIEFNPETDQIRGELEVYPCSAAQQIEPRLAWRVMARTEEPVKNWVFHVDAHTGEVLHSWDGILADNLTGFVDGRGRLFNPLSAPTILFMRHMGVSGSGGAFAFANLSGVYSMWVDPNPRTASSNLGAGGLYARIINAAGAPLQVSGTASAPNPINLLFNPAGDLEFSTSQVTGYWHTSFVHDYLQDRLIPRSPGLDIQIPVTVNTLGSCNAFYTGSAIEFRRAGAPCPNMAYDTIVYHEYGHFLDDALGGIVNGALSEGIGDTAATYGSSSLLGVDQPLVGEGFFGPGMTLRTGDNNRQWPALECGGQVHCVGEVYAGFTWHSRQNMLARGANVRVPEDLVFNSLVANSPNIPAQVIQTFTSDVARYGPGPFGGSPNYYALCEAAAAHGFNSTAPPAIPAWIDFGNAPAPYPTTLALNGARHRLICAEWLGSTNEPLPSVDGEPNTRGAAEVLNDGWVNFTGELRRGIVNVVNIRVNTSGRRERRYNPADPARRLYLRAWADFNTDGAWADPGERVVDLIVDPTTFPPSQRMQTFSFNVTPPPGPDTTTMIRIRLSYGVTTTPVGATEFGEVEDYRVRLRP